MDAKFDILDARALVEANLTALETQFGLTGRKERQKALEMLAAAARELKGEQ